MSITLFNDYLDNLKSLEKKQFQKVFDQYKKLQPRYYKKVQSWIDSDTKRSDKTKETMHKFNDVIYDYLFAHLGFIKESHGFKIGDVFYIKHNRRSGDNPKIISEFIVRPEGVFVIDDTYGNALDTVYMIEQLSKTPRKDGESFFYKLSKEKGIFNDISTTEITSDVSMFLYYYSRNEYDFNPVYQRDLVWSVQKKQDFIKAILVGDTDVRPTFITIPYEKRNGTYSYEVLDGKQRLNAIIAYVRGEFEVEGFYFKDLNESDLSRFYNTPFIYTLVKYYSDKGWDVLTTPQKVELFLQINEYGQKVSDDHLKHIKEKYLE